MTRLAMLQMSPPRAKPLLCVGMVPFLIMLKERIPQMMPGIEKTVVTGRQKQQEIKLSSDTIPRIKVIMGSVGLPWVVELF